MQKTIECFSFVFTWSVHTSVYLPLEILPSPILHKILSIMSHPTLFTFEMIPVLAGCVAIPLILSCHISVYYWFLCVFYVVILLSVSFIISIIFIPFIIQTHPDHVGYQYVCAVLCDVFSLLWPENWPSIVLFPFSCWPNAWKTGESPTRSSYSSLSSWTTGVLCFLLALSHLVHLLGCSRPWLYRWIIKIRVILWPVEHYQRITKLSTQMVFQYHRSTSHSQLKFVAKIKEQWCNCTKIFYILNKFDLPLCLHMTWCWFPCHITKETQNLVLPFKFECWVLLMEEVLNRWYLRVWYLERITEGFCVLTPVCT